MPRFPRIVNAWNAFRSHEESFADGDYATGTPTYSGIAPDRPRFRFLNERSIVTSVYTRIAIDIASVDLRHVQLDEQKRYSKDIDSKLNQCLNYEPNLDQAPAALVRDIVGTLFDKGVAAIVPVDTTKDPNDSLSFDIHTLRVGDITAWYPNHVRVNLYNEAKGLREEILLEKRFVAIVENPLYSVMNEPNSTLQRLLRKLSLLDNVDEVSAGKLDLIIQLPYVVKSDTRRLQAEQRRKDIEFQLQGSQYGVAYTDGTEKITQLNRPIENMLLKEVEYLTGMLYGQLGITAAVMDGTASESEMINYYNRTIEPILTAITQSMNRSFLGTAKFRLGQRIRFFRDPFRFVPLSVIAEIADKFSRNEVFAANEIRGFMGVPPSTEPKADKLYNSNMPNDKLVDPMLSGLPPQEGEDDDLVQSAFDSLDETIDGIFKELGVSEGDVDVG